MNFMVKSEIRKEYQQRRNSMTETEFQLIQEAINQQINLWSPITPAKFLSFLPIPSKKELSPQHLELKWEKLHPSSVKCYPKVISATEMVALEITAHTVYEINVWGIQEPQHAAVFNPLELEAVIVPLLVFDLKGYRVGYGKGFYDRFFEQCSPNVIKVGISAFQPIQEIQDINIYDVPLNYCITPEKIYEF